MVKVVSGKTGLVDDSLDQELIVSQQQEYNDKKELLNNSMKILNERRERDYCCQKTFREPFNFRGIK